MDGLCFDNEHEGISGATSSLILSRVRAFDADNVADVILLGIGGNDISNGNVRIQQIINNIRLIILQLKELYPESMIIVEQIAPGKSQFMTERLSNDLANFNKRLGILIHALSRFNRQLFTVDMSRDWSDTYLADDIHYNDTGAQVVADRYFTIISENYSE